MSKSWIIKNALKELDPNFVIIDDIPIGSLLSKEQKEYLDKRYKEMQDMVDIRLNGIHVERKGNG